MNVVMLNSPSGNAMQGNMHCGVTNPLKYGWHLSDMVDILHIKQHKQSYFVAVVAVLDLIQSTQKIL